MSVKSFYCLSLCVKSEVGNWEGSLLYTAVPTGEGKSSLPKGGITSHLHGLRTFILGEIEVSVTVQTGQAVM